MSVHKPEPIRLFPEERILLARIVFDPGGHGPDQPSDTSLSAAADLGRSLLSREAVPPIRLQYFTAPELNIGGHGKSRRDIFELNGRRGEEILAHPSFLKHLKYFLYGPDLQSQSIAKFTQILADDRGTSGELLAELCCFVRSEVRRLSPHECRELHEEFFKLALELDCELDIARSIRDAAREAARKS